MKLPLKSFLLGATLGAALLGGMVSAQEGVLKVDDFEQPLAGWTAMRAGEGVPFAVDEGATLQVTADAKGVHGGKGSLFYAYEVQPKTVRFLTLPREQDLTRMKALRLWVKTGVNTPLMIGLAEKGGATYNTTAVCMADTWQEVHVNLNELAVGDSPADPNGKLDLDQVTSIQVSDLAHLLVNFVPDLTGRRHLWLDDVQFEAAAAPMGRGAVTVASKPGYLADSFENGLMKWIPISIQLDETPKLNFPDTAVTVDATAAPEGGKRGMKWSYERSAGRIHGLMRDLQETNLSQAKSVHLWMKTEKDGTFTITLEEKDGSRYQATPQITAADGWKELAFPLSAFTIADDSNDENGKLDAAQIKQLGVIDLSTLLGAPAGETVLRLDEVRFRFAD